MTLWRSYLSPLFRELILGHYLIPSSRFGLEAGLVPFLARGAPITLIDVGASSGLFTSAVQAHCGIRQALLVEPQPRRCRELERRFPEPRFVIAETALSDQRGSVPMDILNFDYSSSILPVLPEVGGADELLDLGVREKLVVPLRTLDDLVEEVGWRAPIDLIKIDTQGAELLALKGAVTTLKRTSMVWTEVSFRPMYQGSAVFSDVHAFLFSQGFRLYSLHEGFRGLDREMLQADALFLGPSMEAPR